MHSFNPATSLRHIRRGKIMVPARTSSSSSSGRPAPTTRLYCGETERARGFSSRPVCCQPVYDSASAFLPSFLPEHAPRSSLLLQPFCISFLTTVHVSWLGLLAAVAGLRVRMGFNDEHGRQVLAIEAFPPRKCAGP